MGSASSKRSRKLTHRSSQNLADGSGDDTNAGRKTRHRKPTPDAAANRCGQETSHSLTESPAGVCVSNNNNKHISDRLPPTPITHLDTSDFKVTKLKVTIDKKPTSLDEKSPAVLKYRTPHFSTSWEFPEIVSGKFTMLSDADGKQYPWYGSKHEVETVEGPTDRQTVQVHMNDNFFPQVTWYIPHKSYDRTPRLTHIHRKQHFLTFLVVKDSYAESYHVLRAVRWSMDIDIAVDPDRPLGRRARLLGPLDQSPPTILPESCALEPDAQSLRPPNANNSQTLVWRPLGADPEVVVPPEQTTVDLEKYLVATRDRIRELDQHTTES